MDLALLIGWGADPPGGSNIQFCQFFFQKVHEIEKILVRGGVLQIRQCHQEAMSFSLLTQYKPLLSCRILLESRIATRRYWSPWLPPWCSVSFSLFWRHRFLRFTSAKTGVFIFHGAGFHPEITVFETVVKRTTVTKSDPFEKEIV